MSLRSVADLIHDDLRHLELLVMSALSAGSGFRCISPPLEEAVMRRSLITAVLSLVAIAMLAPSVYAQTPPPAPKAVSYTHLTLPTIYSV